MSIMDKARKSVEEYVDPIEQYKQFMESLSGEDKVKLAFQQTASNYWGKIGKVRVKATKESKGGTKYYLIVADIIKNQEKMKLIQEWFVGKDGQAKPAPRKNITIPDDYATEVSIMLDEEFECE